MSRYNDHAHRHRSSDESRGSDSRRSHHHHHSRHDSDWHNRSRSHQDDQHQYHQQHRVHHQVESISHATSDVNYHHQQQQQQQGYAFAANHSMPSPFMMPPPMGPALMLQPMGFQPVPHGFPDAPPRCLELNEHNLSASALERLHLSPDKITETGIIPNNPYYELPAGLMVPLVPADRREYEPLDPKDLRLPFPKFPDENFLRMIDSYYRDDSDRRNNDGWDRAFIDSFLVQKDLKSSLESGQT